MTDRLPLPEPAKPPCTRCNGPTDKWEGTYTADQMHAYSDACNAALRERVKVLEDALKRLSLVLPDGRESRIVRAALEAK